jgi:hypothetical protein
MFFSRGELLEFLEVWESSGGVANLTGVSEVLVSFAEKFL